MIYINYYIKEKASSRLFTCKIENYLEFIDNELKNYVNN